MRDNPDDQRVHSQNRQSKKEEVGVEVEKEKHQNRAEHVLALYYLPEDSVLLCLSHY